MKGIEEEACPWNEVFTEDEKREYYRGLVIAAIAAVCWSMVLNAVILFFSSMRNNVSYRNLSVFTSVAAARRCFWIFYRLPVFEGTYVKLFYIPLPVLAFFETFFAVFEIEALTHVCIERYVIARYISNGWKLQKKHYSLYFNLCILFSVLYSVPPLLGLGKYGWDFDCETYTFDMILPDNWQKYFVLSVLFLRSFKPLFFMILMLIMCRLKEIQPGYRSVYEKQIHFTKTVAAVAAVTMLCYLPICGVRTIPLYFQFFCGVPAWPTADSIMWAAWLHWGSPVFTTLTLMAFNDRIRKEMIYNCSFRCIGSPADGSKEDDPPDTQDKKKE